jgi:hypothetical protein
MPTKSKRSLPIDKNAQADDTSPKKRLKTEKKPESGEAVRDQVLPLNRVESPAQIEDEELEGLENEPVEVIQAPILDDLYLETVSLPS